METVGWLEVCRLPCLKKPSREAPPRCAHELTADGSSHRRWNWRVPEHPDCLSMSELVARNRSNWLAASCWPEMRPWQLIVKGFWLGLKPWEFVRVATEASWEALSTRRANLFFHPVIISINYEIELPQVIRLRSPKPSLQSKVNTFHLSSNVPEKSPNENMEKGKQTIRLNNEKDL